MVDLQPYHFPPELKRFQHIQVSVDGDLIDVIATDSEPFVTFGADGAVSIEVALPSIPGKVTIHPLRLGIVPR